MAISYIKKRPLLYKRKWPTVIVLNGETKGCASSCNALSVKYVPTLICLHIAFPVLNIVIFSFLRTRKTLQIYTNSPEFHKLNFGFYIYYDNFAVGFEREMHPAIQRASLGQNNGLILGQASEFELRGQKNRHISGRHTKKPAVCP